MSSVSVVIPCHNAAAYLGAALESVLGQTRRPAEVLVVDDGSVDQTVAVAEGYGERAAAAGVKLVVLRQPKKSGVSAARNRAIAQATGKYVAFLDGDDLWLPEKTARQVALLESQPDAVGAHTRLFNFRQSIDDLGRPETEHAKDDPSLEDLVRYHWVTTSTAVVRREALERYRFDETTGHAEDMILFADLRKLGRWRLVDELLTAKRIHGTQATGSAWHRVWSVETRLGWLRKNRDAVGEEAARRLEDEIGRGLVSFLEDRYWRRDLADLRPQCELAAKVCPEAMGRSFLPKVRLYPRWVYRVRDALSSRKGR